MYYFVLAELEKLGLKVSPSPKFGNSQKFDKNVHVFATHSTKLPILCLMFIA